MTTVVNYLPVLSIIGIVFIVLKLIGYISWSWLWVLTPFWAPILLAAGVTFFVFLGAIVLAFFKR